MGEQVDIQPTRLVPCNGCTTCCQGDAVYLHPECGDDPSQYRTERADGRIMLAHKNNGDCTYLERGKGCSIWKVRPTVCREFDCAIFLDPGLQRVLRKDRRYR